MCASVSGRMDGRPMRVGGCSEVSYVEGIPVVHRRKMVVESGAGGLAVLPRGKLVYERYFGSLKPHQPHIGMSVTKSFTGTLAGILVAEGKIDPQAPITDYVPELKTSAFG